MPDAVHQWSPLSPLEVGPVLAGAHFDWWIAGGYALELFVGRSWRPHEDIDILVLRPDLPAVLAHLATWDIWLADPPGHLRARDPAEFQTTAHDIWLRRPDSSQWQLQIMVDEAHADMWQSRRNAQLTLARSAIGWRHLNGLPCLAPHVQLFYKAKAPRPKDQLDFVHVAPHLAAGQRKWLRQAIAQTYGESHLWLDALT